MHCTASRHSAARAAQGALRLASLSRSLQHSRSIPRPRSDPPAPAPAPAPAEVPPVVHRQPPLVDALPDRAPPRPPATPTVTVPPPPAHPTLDQHHSDAPQRRPKDAALLEDSPRPRPPPPPAPALASAPPHPPVDTAPSTSSGTLERLVDTSDSTDAPPIALDVDPVAAEPPRVRPLSFASMHSARPHQGSSSAHRAPFSRPTHPQLPASLRPASAASFTTEVRPHRVPRRRTPVSSAQSDARPQRLVAQALLQVWAGAWRARLFVAQPPNQRPTRARSS